MITGLSHLGLTVRDVEASAAWYAGVLGFRRVGAFEAPDGSRRKVFLRHDALPVRLGLTQHRPGSAGPFDETRTGLDHLAFAVGARADLEQPVQRVVLVGDEPVDAGRGVIQGPGHDPS